MLTSQAWSGPCSQQPEGLAVVQVQGGWQEARGNAGAGAFYVENVRELLDAAGEWFLDEERSELHYVSTDDQAPPAASTFVGARLPNVIEVRDGASHAHLFHQCLAPNYAEPASDPNGEPP